MQPGSARDRGTKLSSSLTSSARFSGRACNVAVRVHRGVAVIGLSFRWRRSPPWRCGQHRARASDRLFYFLRGAASARAPAGSEGRLVDRVLGPHQRLAIDDLAAIADRVFAYLACLERRPRLRIELAGELEMRRIDRQVPKLIRIPEREALFRTVLDIGLDGVRQGEPGGVNLPGVTAGFDGTRAGGSTHR